MTSMSIELKYFLTDCFFDCTIEALNIRGRINLYSSLILKKRITSEQRSSFSHFNEASFFWYRLDSRLIQSNPVYLLYFTACIIHFTSIWMIEFHKIKPVTYRQVHSVFLTPAHYIFLFYKYQDHYTYFYWNELCWRQLSLNITSFERVHLKLFLKRSDWRWRLTLK